MEKARPTVFVGDDNPSIRATLTERLDAEGVHAYFEGVSLDSSAPTKFIGGFSCALLTLERRDGKDDPVDEAELLRMYQPTLPVAFLYDETTGPLLERALALGPVFQKLDQLESAVAWALAHAKVS